MIVMAVPVGIPPRIHDSRLDAISKASIISILDVDNRTLLDDEHLELPVGSRNRTIGEDFECQFMDVLDTNRVLRRTNPAWRRSMRGANCVRCVGLIRSIVKDNFGCVDGERVISVISFVWSL